MDDDATARALDELLRSVSAEGDLQVALRLMHTKKPEALRKASNPCFVAVVVALLLSCCSLLLLCSLLLFSLSSLILSPGLRVACRRGREQRSAHGSSTRGTLRARRRSLSARRRCRLQSTDCRTAAHRMGGPQTCSPAAETAGKRCVLIIVCGLSFNSHLSFLERDDLWLGSALVAGIVVAVSVGVIWAVRSRR